MPRVGDSEAQALCDSATLRANGICERFLGHNIVECEFGWAMFLDVTDDPLPLRMG